MRDIKKKVYDSLFFDVQSYTFNDEDKHIDISSDNIAGCRSKSFCSIDSSLLDKYEESVISGDSNYITYMGDIIPSKVLGLVKTCALDRYRITTHGKWLLHSEMMGTQLMNLFGCPCAYNIALGDDLTKKDGTYNIFSVNFLGKGDKLCTLSKLSISLSRNLESCIKQLEDVLDSEMFDEFSEAEKNKVLSDFAYSYLVRRHVARDTDFYQSNSGVIVNRENKTLRYINFDLEYCYGEASGRMEADLAYCANRFPLSYAKFTHMVEEYRKALGELKEEGIPYQTYIQEQYVLGLACALRDVEECMRDVSIDNILKREY